MARTKLEQTQQAVSASTKVNTKKKVSIDTVEKKETYKCWCCGHEYTKLQGNFTPTNFPLFKHYGFYPVCRKCTDKFYPEMVSFFDGSEEKAIEFICMMYGLYFNESPLAASRKISEHRSRIHTYTSKIQIKPWIGLSLKDTIKSKYKDNTSCMLATDYSIALKHAIKTRAQLIEAKRTTDPITWREEYENEMLREGANAYFTYGLLTKNQTNKKAIYPRRYEDVKNKHKNPYAIPKQNGEIRILACDMAFIERANKNDNSCFTLIRALPESMWGLW